MAKSRRSVKPKSKSGGYSPAGWLILLIAGAVLAGVVFFQKPSDLNAQVSQAQGISVALLKQQGVVPGRDLQDQRSELRREEKKEWKFWEQRYQVPAAFDSVRYHTELESRLKQKKLLLTRFSGPPLFGSWSCRFDIGSPLLSKKQVLYRLILEREPAVAPTPVTPSVPVPSGSKGTIAIVLDDWGYTLKNIPVLESIRQPLTVSILPNLPHSAEVSRTAHARGHEVILHLPMEAENPNVPRENGTLLVGMPRAQILAMMDDAIRSVPGIKGVNNHQGSKATADPVLMRTVLEELKRRRLYFLDSQTAHHSVGPELARQLKVPFAQRAVFLDNSASPKEIQTQLDQLARLAHQKGYAIGIGHDRPATMQLLKKSVPELEKQGYRFVPVSELLDKS